jgi:hypothetical protein
LMFQPSGGTSVSVPLLVFEWSWSAVATADTNGVWNLVSHTNSTPSVDNPTTIFPSWSNKVSDFPTGYDVITNNSCE